MSIKIVTDSACDIPLELVKKYDISVVPLYINIGEKSLLDGVEISREEFYTNLPDYPVNPTTAAPGPGMFQKVYEELAAKGASEIISIHISISLSSTLESARIGAEQTRAVPVTVIDSRQLSLGAGFIVLAAARAAQEGQTKEQILQIIENEVACTYVFAALDTVDFLRRSGRMNMVLASLVSLLQIKPLLKMHNGKPSAERIRTQEKAFQRLIKLVQELGPLKQLALVHTSAPQKAEILRQRALNLFPDENPPLSVGVTPVLGAHIGPGVVGFAVTSQCKPHVASLLERVEHYLPFSH